MQAVMTQHNRQADGGTFGGLELAQLVGALVALAPFLLKQLPQLLDGCSNRFLFQPKRLPASTGTGSAFQRLVAEQSHALTVLVLHQLGKHSRCLAKLRIGPDLNDAALVHHHNPIGSLHRA